MPSKYTILGYSLTIFILFGLWQFLKPKEERSYLLFETKNIDSIQIYESGKTVTVTAIKDLIIISKELKKSRPVDPDRINLNTGFVDLRFFIKNTHKPLSVKILYNVNGVLINANDSYYKNDSLNTFVRTFLNEN